MEKIAPRKKTSITWKFSRDRRHLVVVLTMTLGMPQLARELLTGQKNANLTKRETEVLRGVSECMANKEIASRLCISERTVKFHVSALLAKYKVGNRTELSRLALMLDEQKEPAIHRLT